MDKLSKWNVWNLLIIEVLSCDGYFKPIFCDNKWNEAISLTYGMSILVDVSDFKSNKLI